MVGALREFFAGGVDGGSAPTVPPARRRIVLTEESPVVYAVGDVHGCLDKLRTVEEVILRDAAATAGQKLIVMLGDYLDRGPDSAAVLDRLVSPLPDGLTRICLCGNHEAVFASLIDGSADLDAWLEFGGRQTIASYGIDPLYLRNDLGMNKQQVLEELRRSLPEPHLRFLRTLPVSIETPQHFFCHAGVRPGVPIEEQSDRDLMWIRAAFLRSPVQIGKRVVHGHTPLPQPHVDDCRISLDTGACQGGSLTVARIAGGDVRLFSA